MNAKRTIKVVASLLFTFCVCSLISQSTWGALPNSKGELLFKKNCASCHTYGKNALDIRKPIVGSRKLATKELFTEMIAKGTGAMPPFPRLSKDKESLQALYEYCKSLK